MTYRVAAADSCVLDTHGWTAHAYRRRGVPANRMAMFARQGLSPDVAGLLHRDQYSDMECGYLTQLLSRTAIRSLITDRRITPTTGPERLRQMAEVSLPRMRAWVHRTGVYVANAGLMDDWGIRPSQVANWVAMDPLRRPVDPYPILTVAMFGTRVPREHLAGWLTFATRNQVPYFGQDRSDFLGGDTALFVRAGLSPAEAQRMVRRGRVDRDSLMLMAGLR